MLSWVSTSRPSCCCLPVPRSPFVLHELEAVDEVVAGGYLNIPRGSSRLKPPSFFGLVSAAQSVADRQGAPAANPEVKKLRRSISVLLCINVGGIYQGLVRLGARPSWIGGISPDSGRGGPGRLARCLEGRRRGRLSLDRRQDSSVPSGRLVVVEFATRCPRPFGVAPIAACRRESQRGDACAPGHLAQRPAASRRRGVLEHRHEALPLRFSGAGAAEFGQCRIRDRQPDGGCGHSPSFLAGRRNERHAGSFLRTNHLLPQAVFAQVVAVVAGEDDDRVVGQAQPVKGVQDPSTWASMKLTLAK